MTWSRWRRVSDAPPFRTGAAAVALALLVSTFCCVRPAFATLNNGENAIDILGQYNSVSMADNPADYVKGCVNDGASPYGFDWPTNGVVDSTNHRLFVADGANNRVLVYTLTSGNLLSSKTPAYVLGQADFVSCGVNGGAGTNSPGQATLYYPVALAFDSTNNLLYVSDAGNSRVLVFNTATITNGMNASYELGQPSGGTAFTTRNAYTTQSGLALNSNRGDGLALDTANQILYVADCGNNRVMAFPAYGNASWGGNGENALNELGQPSGGTAFTTNGTATSQSGLNTPGGVALDTTDHLLYVADIANSRVMVFSTSGLANGENASYELGQPAGSNAFTTHANSLSQSGFGCNPNSVTFDSVNNRLFVLDNDCDRVMVFSTSSISNGMNASYVIGQSNFTSDGAATTQSGLNLEPADLAGGFAYDSTNQYLYVMDVYNNRVMIFDVSVTEPTIAGIAQNDQDACAIAGGQLYCWGSNDDGEDGFGGTSGTNGCTSTGNDCTPTLVSAWTNWTVISLGDPGIDPAACGIAGGALYCWGENVYGELGLGNTNGCGDNSVYCTPTQVGASISTTGWTAVSQSGGYACGIASGALYCWGDDSSGELGNGVITGTLYTTPQQVGSATDWIAVSVSSTGHTCGIQGSGSSGTLWCWGDNQYGELGVDFGSQESTPQQVGSASNWTVISSGSEDTCGIAGGNLYCWGYNNQGEDGNAGTQNTVFVTTAAVASGNLGGLAGADTTCSNAASGASLSGTYLPWLTTTTALSPLDTFPHSLLPYKDTAGNTIASNWTQLVSGTLTTGIGYDQAGHVVTAGTDVWTNVKTTGAATTSSGSSTTANCSGWASALGTRGGDYGITGSATSTWTADGTDLACNTATAHLYCVQQDQGLIEQNTPVQVGSLSTWTAVNIGAYGADNNTCGIAGGKLYCWGKNAYGEDGLGNTTQYETPQQVGSLTNWTAVVYQENDTCGVAGGQLYCWGQNANGEDGLGNETEQKSPQAVGGLESIGNGENATDLLGQYSSATSTATVVWTDNGMNNGPNALGFSQPSDVAIDPVNHYLYVADTDNQRVLVYALNTDNSIPTSSGGHTAAYVLGQTTLQGAWGEDNNTGATSASGLYRPQALAVDSANNRLFVADAGNARILIYDMASGISNGMNASYELGCTDFTGDGCGGVHQNTLGNIAGLAYDAVNTRLFVVDYAYSRVTVFSVPYATNINGENAITTGGLLGQTNFTTNNGGATTATGMANPNGVAYDAVNQRLFVADAGNGRVLVYNVAPGFTNDEAASFELGVPAGAGAFTTVGSGLTQSTLTGPEGLSYDPNTNRLFEADNGNSRVLVFNVGPSVIANGENAAYVIGAANFTTNNDSTTQSTLELDEPLANAVTCAKYDPATTHLFVCDTDNNRVMIFDGTAISTNPNSFFIPGYE